MIIQLLENINNLLANKETDAALEMAEQVMRSHPIEAEAYFLGAEAYASKKLYDQAVLCLQQACALSPKTMKYLGRLGENLLKSGKIDEAMSCYQQILDIEPAAWAYIGLGNAYERSGDVGRCIESFQQALQAKDLSSIPVMDLLARLIKLQKQQNDLKGLLGSLQKLADGAPDKEKKYQALCELAQTYSLLENHQQAITHYLLAIECSPELPDAYIKLADIYHEFGFIEQEAEILHQANLLIVSDELAWRSKSLRYQLVIEAQAPERVELWQRIKDVLVDEAFIAEQLGCEEDMAFMDFLQALDGQPTLSCHPLFDAAFYQRQLAANGLTTDKPAIIHYLTEGWQAGLDPHPLFDSEYYRNAHALSDFSESPLEHYLADPEAFEGDPSPFFDEKYYHHVLKTEEGAILRKKPLHNFVTQKKWSPVHPQIAEQSLGAIASHVPMHELKERDQGIVPSHFVDIIRELRCLVLETKKPASDAASDDIELSVIVLNYDKLVHTILAVYRACLSLKNLKHEIIVVDNGSSFFCYRFVARYLNALPNCRVIRLERNRFFGEGNNIALDKAKGDYVCFLNNDAYVGADTFSQLLSALKNDASLGAVAPVFVLPNYTIQEIGGKVSGCGQVIQIAKHTEISAPYFKLSGDLSPPVDYVSAACCMLPRKVLDVVGGFDYIFEPFYYEDTDLCTRVRFAGYQLKVVTGTYIIHFENTSTRDYLQDDFHSLIGINRRKFASRWFERWEQDLPADNTPRLKAISALAAKPKTAATAFVFTPFSLGLGGGEKYILTLASALSAHYQTSIIFPEAFSVNRLRMVAEDLGLSAANLRLLTWHEALRQPKPELFVAMGNEIVPSVPAIGRRNYYHCQFPFPLDHVRRRDALQTLQGFDAFIVNSYFTRREVGKQLREYGLPELPVHIVYPPCWDGDVDGRIKLFREARQKHKPKRLSIVNVGRFFRDGHAKRQDIVLEIIQQLQDSEQCKDWLVTGVVLGGVAKEHEAYFHKLAKLGDDLGVAVQANVEKAVIETAYQTADIYLHAAGFGKCEGYSPHQLEHFGITVVEAMTHGVIPVVYSAGGPLEIVRKIGIGEVYGTLDEAVDKVWKIAELGPSARELAAVTMIEACQIFSDLAFTNNIRRIVGISG